MTHAIRLALAFLLPALADAAPPAGAAEFARFGAEAPLQQRPHLPVLDSARKRNYRSVLTEAAQAGANFNGHYAVARWGCGTGCLEWAVIDLSNGKVFLQEHALSCWPSRPAGKGADGQPADWLAFQVSSSLLYLHSCKHDGSNGAFDTRAVYRFQHGRLRLLRVERLTR